VGTKESTALPSLKLCVDHGYKPSHTRACNTFGSHDWRDFDTEVPQGAGHLALGNGGGSEVQSFAG
jgi:hypothetical protein